MQEPLLLELSKDGKTGVSLPQSGTAENIDLPKEFIRKNLPLPQVSEAETVRHFTKLSRLNFSVDSGFYPLGSCTMKYNPKVNEEVARLSGFLKIHPLMDTEECQGILEVLYNLEQYLCAIFGYSAATLSPAAGAHGELTALMMIKAYHLDKNDAGRHIVIVPDSSHGTNPSSVAMIGYKPLVVKSNSSGGVDLIELKKAVNSEVAALMLTNPNTLGIFDENILEVAEIVHKAGGLLYYDGANANATMGFSKPADLGFDAAHFNLHKTFSTPHGGGGPGAGPVCVTKKLEPFLPIPRIVHENNKYKIISEGYKKTIGRVHSFYGNVGVVLKAYAYIRTLGASGLKDVSKKAVLSANYVMNKLKKHYYLPYDRICQHEFVISAKWQKEKYGIKALDIAKRLIDYGIHPPTIYFPLIVEEALMIEPTETESKKTLDDFCDAMIAIAKECEQNPEIVRSAPNSTLISRLDETKAARSPKLTW